MQKPNLLYLAHRIPFPPNKGDKLRSFHFLKYLSRHFNIHLGCFYDTLEDKKYIDDVREYCETLNVLPLDPRISKLKSILGFISRKALTLEYFSSTAMQRWVDNIVKENYIKGVLVFSSSMAQFVEKHDQLRRVIDFIDIDSDKWKAYSSTKPWPLSWVYKREGEYLAEYEKNIAEEFSASCFVSEAESTQFCSYHNSIKEKVSYVNNGVDYHYFSPDADLSSPYSDTIHNMVFTGAMDYWPNIDAVCWFAENLLPEIQAAIPDAKLFIVGSNPAEKVQALVSAPGITVTGRVTDIRPYIAHANLVIATLRIARGVQNKVLEAMAFNKPILLTDPALEGIVHNGSITSFNTLDSSGLISHAIKLLNQKPSGLTYRQIIKDHYDWENNVEKLIKLIDDQ